MSTTYKTTSGQTFADIARGVYGSSDDADLIARANPGVDEPLPSGLTVGVPARAGSPTMSSAPQGVAPDEVTVSIDGERFRYWEEVEVTTAIDAVSSIRFSAPFEADAPNFRKTFKPFSFKPLTVYVGQSPLFTGVMVGVSPVLDETSRMLLASGYSTPGVLNDCTAPSSAFPLEYNGLDLERIAVGMVREFGVSVIFEAPVGPVFERVACEPTRNILDFLAELAKQRQLLLSSTPEGKLLCTKATATGKPVARLSQGASPVVTVTPSFTPQAYFSHITGLSPTKVGVAGAKYTEKNPQLEGVLRPHTFKAQDTEGANLKEATAAKLGRMFGNMAGYTVAVDTWRDPQGALWKDNTTITLVAPDAMVYKEYEFLIRRVVFKRTKDTESAELEVVLPAAFNGGIPKGLPWDE